MAIPNKEIPQTFAAAREAKRIILGYIGIMENKMETTITYWGNIRVIVGLYWDNGK